MLVIPAIDIRSGKVVRLVKGDFNRQTVYSDKPEEIALKWQDEGAKMLHLVDLDGALEGRPQNIDSIKKILKNITIPVEVGGGIRSYENIERLIEMKVARVILSTAACLDKALLKRAISDFSQKIAVGLDVKDGQIMLKGWKEESELEPADFIKQLKDLGLKRVIYTDIERDGTLGGIQYEKIKDFLLKADLSVIISGGISKLKDIEELKPLEEYGLEGVIIGKALYDGKIALSDALKF